MFCINLNDTPKSVAEAYWYAKLLSGLGQYDQGGDVIYAIGKQLGNWVAARVPSPGFPWFVVGMKNHHLARTAAELLDGKFYSPQDRQIWDLSLGFATLREITTVGPGQDSIGYVRGGDARGVFIFDPIISGQTPTYPSMWAAEGRVKKTILTDPTHEGHPVANQDSRQAEMLAGKADLFISKTLRTTSQALMAARTAEPAMGGRAWNALQTDDDGLKNALAIWLNSSLGGIIRTCYAQTTQTGRATMQTGGVEGFPVPDFASAGPAGEQARQIARERYAELAALPLEPVSYAFRDENRHRIDAAALAMVGLGGNAAAARALSHLRNLWCREPAVHGGSAAIMRALGLRGPRGQ